MQNEDYWSITKLVRKKVEIDLQNNEGRSPAWIACFETKDIKTAAFLFKSGANPYIKDKTGKTLVDLLKRSNNSKHKKLLKYMKKHSLLKS